MKALSATSKVLRRGFQTRQTPTTEALWRFWNRLPFSFDRK